MIVKQITKDKLHLEEKFISPVLNPLTDMRNYIALAEAGNKFNQYPEFGLYLGLNLFFSHLMGFELYTVQKNEIGSNMFSLYHPNGTAWGTDVLYPANLLARIPNCLENTEHALYLLETRFENFNIAHDKDGYIITKKAKHPAYKAIIESEISVKKLTHAICLFVIKELE